MTVINRGYAKKPWECYITINMKKHYGGCFATKLEAEQCITQIIKDNPKKKIHRRAP